MKDLGTALAGFVGVIVLVAVLIIGSALLGGVVLRDLWTWFIVPLGVPAIGLAHAIGINILISFVAKNHLVATKADVDKNTSVWGQAITAIFIVLLAWGMGAIAHSYM